MHEIDLIAKVISNTIPLIFFISSPFLLFALHLMDLKISSRCVMQKKCKNVIKCNLDCMQFVCDSYIETTLIHILVMQKRRSPEKVSSKQWQLIKNSFSKQIFGHTHTVINYEFLFYTFGIQKSLKKQKKSTPMHTPIRLCWN